MQVIEYLTKKIRDAGTNYNPDIQVAPACILWLDSESQWQGIIQTLLTKLPEILILGEYNPEKHAGPAIWLRCVIAGKTDDLKLPTERIPIIYLPAISRQDLRTDKIKDALKPLAELQYSGVMWSQINSKDWTVLAFLRSDQGGLGLDVAQDNETKNAMLRALDPLLDMEIETLHGKRLDKDFFNALLAGDYARRLLQWLDQGDAFKSSIGENEWQAFADICKSKLAFNPEKDGILIGAAKLASHDTQWQPVWERFCEAPKRYANIPNRIRSCKPPAGNIDWWNPGKTNYDRWPQWNEAQENVLRQKLDTLDTITPSKARETILDLEKDHRLRRNLIWAELGEATLAQALEHLSILAQTTTKALNAGTIAELANGYESTGWQADDAMLRALSCVEKQEDIEVIAKAIRAIYMPWAEESARYLQKIVDEKGYPVDHLQTHKGPKYSNGECILFVDGLRFDAAKRLVKLLKDRGCQIEEKPSWASLPTVTSTGKPAVTPVQDKICGKDAANNFEPCIAESDQSLKSYQLKKLLTDSGWQILDTKLNGNINGNAWCEFGDIDREGHERGWKLAKQLDIILSDIRDRVMQLLDSGWKKVRIVTDHGWLLLPGNLPKIELPSAQAETKWGRCAAIKPGALTDERLYPWYWNPNQHFALADGISCFRNGMEYDHGGVSLQECLTLEINVSPGISRASHITPEITDIVWKGLRCTVAVESVFEGLSIDIRTQPGNPSSSVILSTKYLKESGTASVVVENEDLEGTEATIVLINQKGELVTQANTIIGGEGRK
jgi:hypothetical protein